MKKFILPVLAVVLCAGLVACSKDEPEGKHSFNIKVVSDSQPMQTDVYKGGSNGSDGYFASYKSEGEKVGAVLEGLFGENRKLTIEATDSADMAKQLHAKVDAAFASINDEGWVGRHEVRVLWEKDDHITPSVIEYVWGNKNGIRINEHTNSEEEADDYNWAECNMIRHQSSGDHLEKGKFIDKLTLDDIGPFNMFYKRYRYSYAINQDLNSQARGKYIFLRANGCYNTTGRYTDLICIKSEKGYIENGTKLVWEGRTYVKVPSGYEDEDGKDRSVNLNGDCNEGAGGAWLFLFATTDRTNLDNIAGKYVKDIGTISVFSSTMENYKDGYDYLTRQYPKYYNQKEIEAGNIRYVPMIILNKDGRLEKYNEVADFNHGAKGMWIFMILHYQKPEIK